MHIYNNIMYIFNVLQITFMSEINVISKYRSQDQQVLHSFHSLYLHNTVPVMWQKNKWNWKEFQLCETLTPTDTHFQTDRWTWLRNMEDSTWHGMVLKIKVCVRLFKIQTDRLFALSHSEITIEAKDLWGFLNSGIKTDVIK